MAHSACILALPGACDLLNSSKRICMCTVCVWIYVCVIVCAMYMVWHELCGYVRMYDSVNTTRRCEHSVCYCNNTGINHISAFSSSLTNNSKRV